jgi:hypothetical protein
MATITPQPIADATTATKHWQEGTANAGGRWLEGFLTPRENPKTAALEANPAWKAGVQRAITADLYHKGVQQIDLQEMADHAESVGVSAYNAGTQARVGKFGRKIAKVLVVEKVIQAQVRKMPNATVADRAARAAFWIVEMAKHRGTF